MWYMVGDRYASSLDWGDVCDGLRLRLVSSLRDAERERLIGDYAGSNYQSNYFGRYFA
ncbi:hypothetical protein [Nostoc sp.]|uniref:hypothetical protein n=1 Tax=Nostoc sp. TaxID=1180 RepID=UPI002FF9DC24